MILAKFDFFVNVRDNRIYLLIIQISLIFSEKRYKNTVTENTMNFFLIQWFNHFIL